MESPAGQLDIAGGLGYLLAERLLQHISGTTLALTDLVPVAMAHVHPLFTETVRTGQQESVTLTSAIAESTSRVRKLLPGRASLFERLEDPDTAVHRTENTLKVGRTEMETENAAIYQSYNALHCLLNRLMAAAVDNTTATPEEFFAHLTEAFTGPVFDARVKEIHAHFTRLDGFTGA